MLGIILTILGIMFLILGITYFSNKKVWIGIGVIITIIGVYFLFFAATPEDYKNDYILGKGVDPADFEQQVNDTKFMSLYGVVTEYYQCGPEEICIEMLGDDGLVDVKTTYIEDVEGAVEIVAYGHFEESIFIAEDVIIIMNEEDLL